jgi:Transposase
VAQKRRKFSPEFRDEAVKMVVVESRLIAGVAREIQVNERTLVLQPEILRVGDRWDRSVVRPGL